MLTSFSQLYSPLCGVSYTKSVFVWVVHQFQCKACKGSGNSTVTFVSMLFSQRPFVCDGTTVRPTCNIRLISISSTGCNLLSRFFNPSVGVACSAYAVPVVHPQCAPTDSQARLKLWRSSPSCTPVLSILVAVRVICSDQAELTRAIREVVRRSGRSTSASTTDICKMDCLLATSESSRRRLKDLHPETPCEC
jgi:hypothetical protein